MALEMIANIDQSSDKNESNHYIYIFDDTSRLYKPTSRHKNQRVSFLNKNSISKQCFQRKGKFVARKFRILRENLLFHSKLLIARYYSVVIFSSTQKCGICWVNEFDATNATNSTKKCKYCTKKQAKKSVLKGKNVVKFRAKTVS